jgi:NarL family two-component system sensor histidine kinase YdfH
MIPNPQAGQAQEERRPARSGDEVEENRAFYLVFLVTLVIMYGWALSSSPDLRRLELLIPFSALILIHAGLHWITPRIAQHRRWVAPYLAVQGLLLFIINLLAANQGLLIGLYLALSGAAVGLLVDLRISLIPILAYAALAAVNHGLAWGWESVPNFFAFYGLLAFFVVIYVAMFTRQSRARKRAQVLLQKLETAHKKLAEYAARVEDLSVANERQRMARELHDTLAQGLAGLILQLEAADSHLTRQDPAAAQPIIHQAMQRARATLAAARRAIRDLRAEDAYTDLAESVRAEVEHFSSATGITCTLDLDLPPELSPALGEHILRAVSEGLTNVARHAQASQTWLSIKAQGDMLAVILRDDGVGFEPEEVEKTSGHYGLIGLRERARLAGGRLEVESAPGARTTLSLLLPLEREGTSG